MIFPKMVSSRVLVRKTLAATGKEMASIYAREVEAFLWEERRSHKIGKINPKENDKRWQKRSAMLSQKIMIVAVSLPSTLAPCRC